jgi:hypothetical protein
MMRGSAFVLAMSGLVLGMAGVPLYVIVFVSIAAVAGVVLGYYGAVRDLEERRS